MEGFEMNFNFWSIINNEICLGFFLEKLKYWLCEGLEGVNNKIFLSRNCKLFLSL